MVNYSFSIINPLLFREKLKTEKMGEKNTAAWTQTLESAFKSAAR